MKFIYLLPILILAFSSCNNKNGMSEKYDADGLLLKVTNHRNGKLDGRQFFYEKGKLVKETEYLQGKKHGYWVDYGHNRDTLKVTHYRNDSLLSE